jgi:hypothetical protein
MSDDKWCSIGDTIECRVQNPFPQTLRVTVTTPESCAYANSLIASGRWRKIKEQKEHKP